MAVLAILGTSKRPPGLFPYERMESFTFFSQPLIYAVDASRAEIVQRPRQRDFTVQAGWLSSEVELLSGVTCTVTEGSDRRLEFAQVAVQAHEGGSSLLLRQAQLCRRDRPWDRDSAAAVFETEVLEHVGSWRRQP